MRIMALLGDWHGPVEDIGWVRQAYSKDNDYGQALAHLGIPRRHQVSIDTLHGPIPTGCVQTELQKLSRDGCVCLD